jgi:hypothetical protein
MEYGKVMQHLDGCQQELKRKQQRISLDQDELAYAKRRLAEKSS